MSEHTDPVQAKKSNRSPEQLQVLAKAREKAFEIRKQNASLRKAERQMIKEQKDKDFQERMKRVEDYQSKGKKPQPQEPVVEEESDDDQPEPAPVIIKKKKKPVKKKAPPVILVEESESESDDEEPQQRVVIKKKIKQERYNPPMQEQPPAAPSRGQENFEKLYKQMFG